MSSNVAEADGIQPAKSVALAFVIAKGYNPVGSCPIVTGPPTSKLPNNDMSV